MKRVIFNDNFINILITESTLDELEKNANRKSLFKLDDTNCFYFQKYIPKSKKEHVSEKAEKDRNDLWLFKDNDGKEQKEYNWIYFTYLKNAIVFLNNNYYDELEDLTFVCVPAATKADTERRWKKFSSEICEKLGMINGFRHIHVVKDAVQSHYGGGGKPEVEYDKEFFKDKNVILFDDIINTGYTMTRYKKELEDLGANVIQFLAIAKSV